ncbi:MAG TPA: hypothetical protein VF531_06065 [Bacillota bacterium]
MTKDGKDPRLDMDPDGEPEVTMDQETGKIRARGFFKNMVSNHDALNPGLERGQMEGSHPVDVNAQTDINLGALADPGGMDPAMDRSFLEGMRESVKKRK